MTDEPVPLIAVKVTVAPDGSISLVNVTLPEPWHEKDSTPFTLTTIVNKLVAGTDMDTSIKLS